MRISCYLDAKAFFDEAKALKVIHGHLTDTVVEHLEKQRSLSFVFGHPSKRA